MALIAAGCTADDIPCRMSRADMEEHVIAGRRVATLPARHSRQVMETGVHRLAGAERQCHIGAVAEGLREP